MPVITPTSWSILIPNALVQFYSPNAWDSALTWDTPTDTWDGMVGIGYLVSWTQISGQ